MPPGNFSNGGVDTFDAAKQYVGIRLQQGVPLLDRDWNELEDIRRHYERMLRQHYIGTGVPGDDGFAITAPSFAADDDVLIGPGRAVVDGYDVANPSGVLLSEQGDREPLPGPRPGREVDTVVVYLEATVTRVDGAVDADLRNEQDINIETCVRDRLDWAVRAAPPGADAPPDTVPLATVNRRAGARRVEPADVVDVRRTHLNLATTIDRLLELSARIDGLQVAVQETKEQVDTIQHDVNELFWELSLTSNFTDMLFGSSATISVTVRNRNKVPIRGAKLSLSTDWGYLPAPTVVTGTDGRATFTVVGVWQEAPFRPSDVGILQHVADKVEVARLKNPGSIQYANVALEPMELAVISRYTPPSWISDIANEIPIGPIVDQPVPRTATVTVHATEAGGSIVRGVGSIQVHFGQWMRDWTRTKLLDIVDRVQVDARIGDAMRRSFDDQNQNLDLVTLTQQDLPEVFQDVNDRTGEALKLSLFDDPTLGDDQLRGSGTIGQVIAQEATAAIGAAANRALVGQIDALEQNTDLPDFDARRAKESKTQLVQAASQLAAGIAQGQKQLFTVPR